MVFSDSSWQDFPGTGRSTDCYFVFYQGVMVDQSIFMPTPVALSGAEEEYNTTCTAAMAGAHHRMLYNEFRLLDPDDNHFPVTILLDSQSAQAMGSSFRDSKHTRHITRRWHYVREGSRDGKHVLVWIDGDLELADIGTKNLDSTGLQPRLRFMMVTVPN